MWSFHQCKWKKRERVKLSCLFFIPSQLTPFLSQCNRLTIDSENVIGDFSPSFDVDLSPFLSKADSYASEFTLDTLFANLSDLLTEVASYAPDLNAGDSPTALNGLFDIVDDVSQFSDALEEFLQLINSGEISIQSTCAWS